MGRRASLARIRGRGCGGVIQYGQCYGSVEMRGTHGKRVNEVGRVWGRGGVSLYQFCIRSPSLFSL